MAKKILPIVLALIINISFSFSQTQIPNESEFLNVNFNEITAIQIDQLELQAHLHFLNSDYLNAAKQYLQIIKYNIDDAFAYYRLACCYAKLNRPEDAGNFLILAINTGFDNYDMIKNEKCFEEVKSNNSFAKAINEVLNYGKKFGRTVYITSEVLVKSRVFLPDDYDSTRKYNLLVGLHGYGGNAENFGMINTYIKSGNYIFVVPEAPYLKINQTQGERQYSWGLDVNDAKLWKKSDPAVVNYIIKVVDYFNEKYLIDNNYLLGFSQGAAYAYATGIKKSDKIDGIIAFGGRLPDIKKYSWFLSKDDLIKGRKIKICIVHGNNDIAVDFGNSTKAKRLLSKYDYKVEHISFEGGHIVNEAAFNKAISWVENK